VFSMRRACRRSVFENRDAIQIALGVGSNETSNRIDPTVLLPPLWRRSLPK
jgi:hypothetical protein